MVGKVDDVGIRIALTLVVDLVCGVAVIVAVAGTTVVTTVTTVFIAVVAIILVHQFTSFCGLLTAAVDFGFPQCVGLSLLMSADLLISILDRGAVLNSILELPTSRNIMKTR